MKDAGAFVLVLCIMLYGCAIPPADTVQDQDMAFRLHSYARQQAFNDWWSQ